MRKKVSSVAALKRAQEIFERAQKKEMALYGMARLEAVCSGELPGTTSYDIAERVRELAREEESDREVLALVDELVEHHWERLFYLTTLHITDPD